MFEKTIKHDQASDIETLSKLALRAAKELDKLHRGKTYDHEAVNTFLKSLDNIKLDDDDTPDARHSDLVGDPMTITSLQHAMGVRKLKDLESKIQHLSNAKITRDNADNIMESCLKIHRHLMPMRRNHSPITGKMST